MSNAKDKVFGFLAELAIFFLTYIGINRLIDIWIVDWTPATKAVASGVAGGLIVYPLLKYIKRKGGWI